MKSLRLLLVLAACSSAHAADDEAWSLAGSLAAPEANQAAAADEKSVYAITNTHVARYHRESGQRTAVSSGPALHLNSGFLWQGRLYCAHSNYPLVPEKSEIKVLDLESMQLTTFKDFGNFGGSLTWAIRRDGHWWCNFARYGADNRQTFLVKFDNEWREVARWTYPREVVAELGRHSLSGGVWRRGELLVTGHDDPVLFRLRLPSEGNVLELVGKQAIPFSGQGIAADPLTGGLVGIHRARKQVLFASAPAAESRRLRVLSYNIHHGEGVDGKLDLERIARVILSAEPDLVALQEVDSRATRSMSVDQPGELARLTDMRIAFGGNIKLQGGWYGNTVLSRLPIRSQTNRALPNFEMGEQRGVQELEIGVPGLKEPLLFFNTHLDHRRSDEERLASAKAINELAVARGERPALLAGDLNATIDSRVMAEFARQWTRAGERELPTIPVARPARQIDFILFRPAARWKVIDVKVLEEAVASDHRPILAVVELADDPK
jgi:endonuclease/exonuclease/phosphatase family metal-dependent hydrolase